MPDQQKQMPKVGFGLWKVAKETCADAVYNAIKVGYRHLDSASDYGNEVEVGQGIQRALADKLCRREDLWITSKLWNTYHRKEHVEPAIRKSLHDLQLDYLDLYLIHFPIAQPYVDFNDRYPPEWIFDPKAAEPKMEIAPVPLYETWQGMEALVEAGLTHKIGVCNYNTGLLNDLMAYAKIKPAVLQVESHPYLTQQRLMQLARDYAIEVTAFSPLGALSYLELDMAGAQESVLEQAVVKQAAKRLNKTPAQVVLRWGVQRGNAIVPKTSRPERLAENLAIFDFSLSEQEMAAIDALNCNRRFNDPGQFCAAAFHKFYPIYD
ncbi:MAG: aldo/keto reductase [Paraglaciecola sp.]|nr:aldo/keto reductase [Paraglaciecola sp.]NCT48190.1 aldo/keto reductase [Paraglaciecola sp.]